nr:submaxillary gland androgen-regulated protein 3A-like [Setaria viridis]
MRTRVTFVPSQPSTETAPVTQTYPRSRDVNFDVAYNVFAEVATELMYDIDHFQHLTNHQHETLYRRALGACNRFLRAVSCRGGRGDVVLPPQATYPRSFSPPPTHQAGMSSQPPVHPPYPGPCTAPQPHALAAGPSWAATAPPPFWHAAAGPSTISQYVTPTSALMGGAYSGAMPSSAAPGTELRHYIA